MLKIMNKKLNTFALTTALALSAEAINTLDFNLLEIYNQEDFRVRHYAQPFPIIFHYNEGGLNSTLDVFQINAQQPAEAAIPQGVRNFIQQNRLQNVQYFEAYCKVTQADCNYFTHTWSMDKMIANRVTNVSTGMFEAHNLAPINEQIGVNTLVAQNMSYHNRDYLSGNVARFQILNPTQLADAWFISVYNPNPNDGNSVANQQPKTIVVHWYFFKNGMTINAQQYPTLVDAITGWDLLRYPTVVIDPQMTPVR